MRVLPYVLRHLFEVVVLIPLATVLAFTAADLWPAYAGLTKVCLVFFVVWRMVALARYHIVYGLDRPENLARVTERDLFSNNWYLENQAIGRLAALVGNRFGFSLWPGRKRQRCIAAWRQWWTDRAASLTWDPVLGRYID